MLIVMIPAHQHVLNTPAPLFQSMRRMYLVHESQNYVGDNSVACSEMLPIIILHYPPTEEAECVEEWVRFSEKGEGVIKVK